MTAVGNGRYILEGRIAAGGMGEVWRATDTSLGRAVAIKLLRPEVADDANFRAAVRDRGEARGLVARSTHRHRVRLRR